jgi:hypothetical protein
VSHNAQCRKTHIECAQVEISRLQAVEKEQETEITEPKTRHQEIKTQVLLWEEKCP